MEDDVDAKASSLPPTVPISKVKIVAFVEWVTYDSSSTEGVVISISPCRAAFVDTMVLLSVDSCTVYSACIHSLGGGLVSLACSSPLPFVSVHCATT